MVISHHLSDREFSILLGQIPMACAVAPLHTGLAQLHEARPAVPLIGHLTGRGEGIPRAKDTWEETLLVSWDFMVVKSHGIWLVVYFIPTPY